MAEEIRELASWFKEWQGHEQSLISSLPELENYGKGVPGIFSYMPKFDGDEPQYLVKQIDRELELYTLHEGGKTLGIGDLLEGLFKSSLLDASRTKLDAALRANIKSGLVCYVQPKIAEDGTLLEHSIEIETTLSEKSAADVLVIIAKAGSRLRMKHEFVGGGSVSLLGRQVLIVCEDDAMVHYSEKVEQVQGALSVQYLSLIGPSSNIVWNGVATAETVLRMHVTHKLIGEGASCTSEMLVSVRDDVQYDILNIAYLNSDTTHATIHTAGVSGDAARLIYRDGIVSEKEYVDCVDEARLLMVGDRSRIDALPAPGAQAAIRNIVQSHVDTADDTMIRQFFGHVVDSTLYESTKLI